MQKREEEKKQENETCLNTQYLAVGLDSVLFRQSLKLLAVQSIESRWFVVHTEYKRRGGKRIGVLSIAPSGERIGML